MGNTPRCCREASTGDALTMRSSCLQQLFFEFLVTEGAIAGDQFPRCVDFSPYIPKQDAAQFILALLIDDSFTKRFFPIGGRSQA